MSTKTGCAPFWNCLELPSGIPSRDTPSDIMGRLNKTAFAQASGTWVRDALPTLAGRQVAPDGKSLRGSASAHQAAAHLMSAFATHARLVLEHFLFNPLHLSGTPLT